MGCSESQVPSVYPLNQVPVAPATQLATVQEDTSPKHPKATCQQEQLPSPFYSVPHRGDGTPSR